MRENLRKIKIKKEYKENDEWKKKWIDGYFHMFGQVADENGSDILAIVELEDGTVCEPYAYDVKFIDK